MIRHGSSPYLECSSRGDKRFSAFFANVNGSSIETQYQAAKIFADGSTGLTWRSAKGRAPTNTQEVQILYAALWDQYISEHPELASVLLAATGVSDIFGQPGHVCQATELWRIRDKLLAQIK